MLVPRLSDKKQDVRSSIICLLNNFILASIDYHEAQDLLEQCLQEGEKCSKIPLAVQSVCLLFQDVVENPDIRPHISISKLVPFVLQQYATSANLASREEAVKCLLLFYSHTGLKMKNDIVKRAKSSGYDIGKMDSLYRKFENTVVLAAGDSGSTATRASSKPSASAQPRKKLPFSSNTLKNPSSSSLQSSNGSGKQADVSSTGAYDIDAIRAAATSF